jgi:S1-C subfamily serine protease
LSLSPVSDASATIPDFAGPQAPSLAPLLREVTPAVVNISVRGRVKEDNPLYQDPVFRQFFDVPKQLERQVQATGSGVIVDAERGLCSPTITWLSMPPAFRSPPKTASVSTPRLSGAIRRPMSP